MTLTADKPVRANSLYTRTPWGDHLKNLRWKQGEHVFLAAPTSGGKTTLMSKLVRKRAHVVVFVTKMKDPTFKNEFQGWTRLEAWPKEGPPAWMTHILLWPRPGKTLPETEAIQRAVFSHAMDAIAREGNRCIVVDEMLMFVDPQILNLGKRVGQLHYFGRSSGISMLTLTQRPSWIPRVVMSSVSHAYITRTTDSNDIKRLSDLGGIDKRITETNLAMLPTRHDYLYLNPQGDATPTIVNTRK